MYRLIAAIVGWLLVVVLAVSYYKSDRACAVRASALEDRAARAEGQLAAMARDTKAAQLAAQGAREAADVMARITEQRADATLQQPAGTCEEAATLARQYMEARHAAGR